MTSAPIRSSCLLVLVLLLGAACGSSKSSSPTDTSLPSATTTSTPGTDAASFALTSTAFEDNGAIPPKYACGTGGQIPPLAWKGVPTDATSLALIVHDPDAPIKGGFTHWVVAGLSATAGKLPPLPTGAREIVSWRPPCPPPGPAHHYRFTLYALNRAAAAADAIPGAAIAKTTLVGTYKR